MRTRIAGFNAEAGRDLIALKVGLHVGACLAVTFNDRLDYFGATVNVAARVQALAGAGEIVVTEDVLAAAGAEALVAGLPFEATSVELRGISGLVGVRRLRA
jgi:class 3 adenylate cyclase